MSQTPITIQHSCRVPVPIELCFKTFVGLHPKDFLHHDKLIARVVRVDVLKGKRFDHVGAVQEISFKDGAVIQEELMAFIPNKQIVYRGTGFTQPLVSWADHVKASFEFSKEGEETVITWRYNFFLKSSPLGLLRKPVFKRIVVDFIWNRMMTNTLANLVKVITLRATAR